MQDRHLSVGVLNLSLHQGDPHQVVPLPAERQNVNGTACDVEHQPGQLIAVHQGQQLQDSAPLHHDLLHHLVVPVPSDSGCRSLKERR